MSVSIETIVNLTKRRGFIYPASEIYGGISGFYDWGPYGVELKNNVKSSWWQAMVYENRNIVGLDSAIIQNPKVWEASGHVERFTDPMVDCKKCKMRFRADHIPKGGKCPNCGAKNFTPARQFNLLMKTHVGPVEEAAATAYLRGETCQGIYMNFKTILDTTRQKLPFGIAQIGKAFRNEITPGDFIFRQREFEQMEMQYFIDPKDAKTTFATWKEARMKWHRQYIRKENLRFREHKVMERAHYAKDAWDIEYKFEHGFREIEGIHNRGDWDLSRHSKFCGADLSYFDEARKKRFVPYIIETSAGVDRTILAVLADAYHEEEVKGETRVVLKLSSDLAPVKVAVLPLSKDAKLSSIALKIWKELSAATRAEYDETQSIGKRYRRQDEIGTPYCVTIDFDSLKDKAVTVRDRDTMKQIRVKLKELVEYLKKKF